MKLTKIDIASTLSAFAFISTAALAETFNFGEGQSSMSGSGGASHHTPPSKHKKTKKTQRADDKGAHSQP